MIIAICGLADSGKSVSREFFESKGFINIHLGVTEIIMKKYGKTTEKLERDLRKRMREEQGMGVMVKIVLPQIKDILKKSKDIVIDNLYSWDEYKILKEEYPDSFYNIAVHVSREFRYERLAKRKFRGLDRKTALSRDYSHIEELDSSGPIALADFHVINDGTRRELKKQLEQIYNRLVASY